MKLIKENIPFTMVANEVLYNKNLSFKAKGLYAYLFSKPDTWDFSGDRIIMETVDGRKAIFSALKELEKQGYLFRNRSPSGKMEYNLKYSANNPMPKTGNGIEEPTAQKGYVPKRLSGEMGSISNIEEKVISKEESNTSEETSQVVEVIDSFKVVNPSYSKLFANTTQRAAANRMLKAHGFEKVKKMIALLPTSNLDKYAPVITTPLQLEDKMGQLATFWQKKKNNQPIIL